MLGRAEGEAMERNTFFVKLCELEQDYQMIEACLHLCQSYRAEELHRALEEVKRACMAFHMHLEDDIRRGRSAAVSELAEAQETYYLRAKELTERELPSCLCGESGTPDEGRREARMLYAEYAVDFARQSIYHALLAVLSALESQSSGEENADEEESDV